MTRNFKILEEYEVSSEHNEEIKKTINKIEQSIIKNDDVRYIHYEIQAVLKMVIQEEPTFNGDIDSWIKRVIEINTMPSRVMNAFVLSNKLINEVVQLPKKDDLNFVIEPDNFSIVQLLKCIFIIIKYFAKVRNRIYDDFNTKNDFQFDSSIYLGNQNLNGQIKQGYNENQKISSKVISMFDLINSEFSFLVPPYQRNYSWEDQAIDVFVQDIKDRVVDHKPHYLGSIALGTSVESKILHIIDGQQRITTSLLIMKAIIASFESRKLSLPDEKLELLKAKLEFKYINKTITRNRINHIQQILRKNAYNLLDKDFANSNAYKNYVHIKDKLKEMSQAELTNFYNAFSRLFQVTRIIFKTDASSEIQIFDDLNSKGTTLTEWDLIKNHIYKKTSLDLLMTKEIELERVINKFFVLKAAEYSESANKKNKNLSNFFKVYCQIEHKLKYGKALQEKTVGRGKVYRTFATLWPKNVDTEFNKIEDFEKALEKLARLFHIYSILLTKEYLKSESKLFDLKLHLVNLEVKKVYYPLVINAIYENASWTEIEISSINENKMQKLKVLISSLDKYVTRLIVSKNTGQSLGIFLDNLISKDIDITKDNFIIKIRKGGTQSSLPAISELKKEILQGNAWQEAYAKSVLRTLSWNHSNYDWKKHNIWEKVYLEKIFPEDPKLNSPWFKDMKMSWADFADKWQVKVNKIGNYLIVDNSKGSFLKDPSTNFQDKKSIYDKFADEVLLTGKYGFQRKMNLLEKSKFTFDDIDQRSIEIADLAIDFYKFPFE